jgi:hypothetical protein
LLGANVVMPDPSITSRPPGPLPPEAELLLTCARLQLSPEQGRRIEQLLAEDLNWSRVLDLAEVHGLWPLLFRHLGGGGRGALPRDVESQLWIHHEQVRKKNERMADELETILQLFERHGIPAMPYKGPVLAQLIYGDLALRQFGDLDLLLPVDTIPRAKALLAESGIAPMFPLAPAVEAAFLRAPAHYHWMLSRGQGDLLVELHWKTDAEFPVTPIGDSAWWNRLGTVRFRETDVLCLAPQELVLALCLHGSKHYWASLHWLVDVAEYLRQTPGLDWSWILRKADKLQAGRRLALALRLIEQFLDVPLPGQVREWMAQHPIAGPLAATVSQRWFQLPQPEPNPFQRLALNLKLYESTQQRLRHATDMMLRPSLVEWSRWPLPRPLFAFYLPLRAIRLMGKHLGLSRAKT